MANRKVAGRTRNQRYRYLLWGALDGVTEPILENAVEGGYAGEGVDAYWDNVIFLEHFEDTEGATIAAKPETSYRGAELQSVGNATIDTNVFKIGTSSLRLEGSIPAVTAPDSPLLIPDVAFTMECWLRFETLPSTAGVSYTIMSKRNTGAQNGWIWYVSTGTNKLGMVGWSAGGAPDIIGLAGTTALQVDTWYHVAVTHDGANDWNLWLDGVNDGNATASATVTNNPGWGLYIGRDVTNAAYQTDTNIDGIRITRGVERYTTTFTPPSSGYGTPSAAPTTDSLWNSVSLMIHADGADASTSFTDSSTNANTVTAVNAAVVDTDEAPISTTNDGHIYCPNDIDHLTVANDASMTLGSGDWTIEFWVRPESVALGAQIMYDQRQAAVSSSLHPTIYATGDDMHYYVSGVQQITATAGVTEDAWQHICVEKFSGTTTMYINGEAKGTYSDSNTYAGGRITLGQTGDFPAATGAGLVGHMSEVRVTKGTARYQGAFTPSPHRYPDTT